ncbi:Dipeptidyl peptidase 4 [Paramarasmius palmivorus]|uniref:Dipeptidyl peptidase 4 n=1 Tax=Paramarasmius palmivorus TaxID=297713 RepID=A0AAW0B9D6_9AGAR
MAGNYTYSSLSTTPEDSDSVSTIAPSTTSTSTVHKKSPLPTYYGDGPFDAPSSDSDTEEDDELLEKPASPGIAESQIPKKRPSGLKYLITTIVALLLLSCVIGLFAAKSYTSPSRIYMDALYNGTFYADRVSVEWVAEAGDGVFSVDNGTHITLVDLNKPEAERTSVLVDKRDLKDEQGRQLNINGWWLSPSSTHILLRADWLKQWRHSSHGNFYIHSLESKTTHPITPPSNPPVTAYAEWSSSSTTNSLVFVKENDLYYLPTAEPSTQPIRITDTGNATRFNGVPDWVYEEEVFSADSALWWAPGGERLVYLEFDETEVPEYTFPIYNPSSSPYEVHPYTEEIVMRYPKPGYPNPIVRVHLLSLGQGTFEDVVLDWSDRMPLNDSVIQEIAWVTDKQLLMKEVNRNADDGRVLFYDFNTASTGKVVRKLGKDGEEGDEGWIESSQNIYPIEGGYLDIVPTKEGFNHIALFSPPDAQEPRWITGGEWEVVNGVRAVVNDTVFFEGTKQSSIERHLYSASLSLSKGKDVQEPTWLTKSYVQAAGLEGEGAVERGYFSTAFSPGGGFYVLSYQGPSVPWQSVLKTPTQQGGDDWEFVLTTNERLGNVTLEYESPTYVYGSITIDGYELNTVELLPPHSDLSGRTKYPVLFHVYGGPASQTVDTRWSRAWRDYVVCGLGYVLVVVDGRGTGFKGRKLRNPVKNNLGFWEGKDQVGGARAPSDPLHVPALSPLGSSYISNGDQVAAALKYERIAGEEER